MAAGNCIEENYGLHGSGSGRCVDVKRLTRDCSVWSRKTDDRKSVYVFSWTAN